MKHFLILLFCIPLITFSQRDIEQSVNRISTITLAQAFLKTNKNKAVSGEILTFTQDEKNSGLTTALFNLNKGEKKVENTDEQKIVYKVIAKKKAANYNISIMEFDSNKQTIAEINSLRSFILKGIKSGVHKFENLARVYSSHPTAKTGGNLGWTKAGTFSKRFEKAVADKRTGQVFTYDEHRQRKHYVVYKVEDNKTVNQITVLKLIQTK